METSTYLYKPMGLMILYDNHDVLPIFENLICKTSKLGVTHAYSVFVQNFPADFHTFTFPPITFTLWLLSCPS